MRQVFKIILLSLLICSWACTSGSNVDEEKPDDVVIEWDETGVEEDSAYEDIGDIRDEDNIDNESEVIDEKAE